MSASRRSRWMSCAAQRVVIAMTHQKQCDTRRPHRPYAETVQTVELLEDTGGVFGIDELVDRPDEYHDEYAQMQQQKTDMERAIDGPEPECNPDYRKVAV